MLVSLIADGRVGALDGTGNTILNFNLVNGLQVTTICFLVSLLHCNVDLFWYLLGEWGKTRNYNWDGENRWWNSRWHLVVLLNPTYSATTGYFCNFPLFQTITVLHGDLGSCRPRAEWGGL